MASVEKDFKDHLVDHLAMGRAAPPSSGCPGPHPTWP